MIGIQPALSCKIIAVLKERNTLEIFKHTMVNVRNSCKQNMSQILKAHNKTITQIKQHHQLECKYSIKSYCSLLNIDCWEDIIHKCTALTTLITLKEIIQMLRKMKETKKETSVLVWEILQTAAPTQTWSNAPYFSTIS